MSGLVRLAMEPLTRAAFAPFGEVIEADGAERKLINEGTTERFHALANVDVAAEGGVAVLSIFRVARRSFPFTVKMLERHPLGSQAFYPLSDDPWLVVVAEGGDRPDPATLRAFRATGRQGVNYRRGAWHHPLLTLQPVQSFLVADRSGPGSNLDEVSFDPADHRLIVL